MPAEYPIWSTAQLTYPSDVRAGLVLIGIAFILAGLQLLAEVGSRFARDAPFSPGNNTAVLSVLGVLFLVSGVALLFRRRRAIFLGLPLLIVAELDAIRNLLHAFSEGNQPGSFAAIGVPIFGLLAVVWAVSFIALLRAALARG